MNVGRAVAALSLFALASCAPAAPNQTSPSASEGPLTTSSGSVATPAGSSPAPFENPGGMWLPEQLGRQAETFKSVGFSIDPGQLTKPTEFPLGAVVSLGGCSASFVSPDGLVITNHHCVGGALQINSTESRNLKKTGFLAKTRAEELTAGPAAKILVTQAMKDVTAYMRADLPSMSDDLSRYKAVEDRTKKLVAECERGRETIKCAVVPFFGGAEYRLIEQLELRDVRLVYAPPEMIGAYGGEIDNWRWPRHDGDFAFLRAYVGKDGKPADFAEGNVPYRPAHVLKLAKEPLAAGAPVMVAGYPARTNRLTTAYETKLAVESDLPYTIELDETYLAELDRVTKADPSTAIKAEPFVRGLNNSLTNTKGQLEGLKQGGLLDKKVKQEAELAAWIGQSPERKSKLGDAVSTIDRIVTASRESIGSDRIARELSRFVRSYGAAYAIVRNAEERAKPDAERDPDYQDRTQRRLEYTSKQLTLQLSTVLDKALLRLVAERELALPEDKRIGLVEALVPRKKGDKHPPKRADLEAAIDKVFKGTKLTDEKTRLDLLKSAKLAELESSNDPLIKLAVQLRAKMKEADDRDRRLTGAMLLARPPFANALRERAGGLLAPDANGSLRITYGTVRGYAPKPGAPMYKPFTVLSEVVKKHTGVDPFDAPKGLLDAVAAKKFGPYVDASLGEVPVDFLADLDISGGNSGSATLNARGELVGLAFDGNYESQAQSWIFIPELTRSIHVDLRYILWVMDAVDGADELLREMGVEPAIR